MVSTTVADSAGAPGGPNMSSTSYKPESSPPLRSPHPFYFGGVASCVATFVSHPFDLTKVRLQTIRKVDASGKAWSTTMPGLQAIKPTTMFRTMISIARREGVRALYSGLSASLLRQGTYSTIRFGLYEKFKWMVAGDQKPTFRQLVFCSTAAGILGGASGNPSDVVNVRMQNDGQLPPQERRNYKNAIDGLVRIWREEGPRVLLRGLGSSTNRAVIMTVSQMTSYDVFKEMFVGPLRWHDNLQTHFAASLCSGVIATTACSPLDVVKTRIMSAHNHDGKHPIRIMIHMIETEGVRSLFRGWTPAFVRLGPHTIVTFIVLEEMKKWHTRFVQA